jgi:hypothetical protein
VCKYSDKALKISDKRDRIKNDLCKQLEQMIKISVRYIEIYPAWQYNRTRVRQFEQQQGGINMDAYQEFLQKRSDEIIANDEKCKEINSKILQLEKEIIPLLTDEAKRKFFEIEALSNELLNHIPTICCR